MTTRTRIQIPPLALLVVVAACGGGDQTLPWPGAVEADVDDLTGARTGLYRTYGPTAPLAAGPDTIPVTIGYWCRVEDTEEPLTTATDGLFLKVSLADTSLTTGSDEAFNELRGILGLLDAARMAIDGTVSAWKYRASSEPGVWFLDGEMGFDPSGYGSRAERDALLALYAENFEMLEQMARQGTARYRDRVNDQVQRMDAFRVDWPLANDYAGSHYRGREAVAVELVQVVRFPMAGFDAAMDSVRFWCSIPQSHHEWNAERASFFGAADSLRLATDARVEAMSEAAANRRLAQQRELEREQRRKDSIRERLRAQAVRAAVAQRHLDSIQARTDSLARARSAAEARARVDARVEATAVLRGGGFTEAQAMRLIRWAERNGLACCKTRDSAAAACRAALKGAAIGIPRERCKEVVRKWGG